MKVIRAKKLLTEKQLQEYLALDPKKQKKYLENLQEELFEEYEFERKR